MYYDMKNITIHGQRQTVKMRLHEDYWKATVTGQQGSTSTNLSNFDMNSNCYIPFSVCHVSKQLFINKYFAFCFCLSVMFC